MSSIFCEEKWLISLNQTPMKKIISTENFSQEHYLLIIIWQFEACHLSESVIERNGIRPKLFTRIEKSNSTLSTSVI